MDFNGTWKVYYEENVEDFLRVIGAPAIAVKMRKDNKPVIVIEQKGEDFTCTIKTPVITKVHSFTIGKETEMTAVDGRKFKVIQSLKLLSDNDGACRVCCPDVFTSLHEMKRKCDFFLLFQTMTAGSVTFISKSKRV
uniref:Fatty acid binding protein 10b, liver basic n=1 Tax=Labrus bergylta TaxID=56723 RepID=A0A3Q3F9L2_9LABR